MCTMYKFFFFSENGIFQPSSYDFESKTIDGNNFED